MSHAPHLNLRYLDITDPETIARNGRGAITPQQERRVRQMLSTARTSAITGLVGAVGLLFFFAFTSINTWTLIQAPQQALLTIWLPLAIFSAITLAAEGALLVWAGRAWHAVQQTEADLRERRIAQGDGEVVWGRGPYRIGMYIAVVGGRTLRAPAHSLQLPPGPYRCFYLASSGWLLSAQPLTALQSASPPAPDAPQPATALAVIARQHGFTLADLEANRRGELSPRQRRALHFTGLLWGALALALGLCAGWLTLQQIGALLAGEPGFALELSSVVVLLLVWAAAIGFLVYAARRLNEARAPRPVRAAGGALNVHYKMAGRLLSVYYHIGGMALELSGSMIRKQAYNSVIEGRRYRVYYRERTRTVVSLEPVGPLGAQ